MNTRIRVLLLGAVLVAGAAAAAMFLGPGPFTSQAVQSPTMSLDMVTAGTTYDETTNTMTVGTTENCLTSSTGNPATHLHQAHLVIQNVEDLVGWQVRLNYIGDKMRPQGQNAVPFTDNTTAQNVGFTNLPIDAVTQVHRDVTAAQSIPAAPADNTNTPQTALLGATYVGAQSVAISPDTPAKPVPDDPSYSAPSGGVLSLINLQVVGDESGQPSLIMNLDDGSPNPVGSKLVIFTGSGLLNADLALSALGDGFHGEGATCVPLDCVNYECPPSVPGSPVPTPGTTIDGGQAGPVVVFQSREGRSSILNGFTIRNGATYFGAGASILGASPTIKDNVFLSNTAFVGGSGAGIEGHESSGLIEGNVFRGNSCDDQSGAAVLSFYNHSSAQLLNNVIANNPCRGISMYLTGTNDPVIVNNTLLGNRVGIRSYSFDASSEVYINNIVVQNTVGIERISQEPDPHRSRFEHNLVFGNSLNYSGFTDPTGTNGNISADPLLMDICHLQQGSPAIDAGDNAAPGLPAKDFDGDDRIVDGNGDGQSVVEIGPDEFTASTPPLANPACTPTPPPTTIHVPADQPTIQRAIDVANEGDTVLVAPGSYYEKIEYRGKNVLVKSEQGPDVTIIDAQSTGTVVKFVRGEGPDGTLDGFTVRGGFGGAEGGIGAVGGIAISDSSPIVKNNKIVNNRGCEGVGINISFASPVVQGNVISGNNNAGCAGGIGGGGIFIGGDGKAQILDNDISNNNMAYYCCQRGGGISLWAAGSPVIKGNIISRNEANTYGGGIDLVNHSDAVITQNLITENRSGLGGGISWIVPYGYRGPLVVNNTIAYNSSTQDSGILADDWDSQTVLVNNVVFSDSPAPAILCSSNDDGPPIFKFNDVFNLSGPAYGSFCGSPTGLNGNISVNPLFVNSSEVDYHISTGSPAIDAGDNGAPDLPGTDFDGEPRVLDGNGDGNAVVDMGVDEYVPPASTSTPTASPTPTPTPTSIDDAAALKISVPNEGGATTPIDVRVQNLGDQSESIGVYADVIPPGGPSNPYGCTPSGRVLETTVTLAPGQKMAVSPASFAFTCADDAGARGKPFTIVGVVDAHSDDLGACGPGRLQSMPCYNALATDDSNPTNNRITRSCCKAGENQ